MARKTVIRRLFKYLPVSIEMNHAIGLDEQWERAEQDNEDVIESYQSNVVLFSPQEREKIPAEAKPDSISLPQSKKKLEKVSKEILVTAFDLMKERLDEQRKYQKVKGVEAVERLKTLMPALQNERGK